MHFCLLLLFVVSLPSAAPASFNYKPPLECRADDFQTISLTPNDWTLPVSSVSDHQYCQFQFIVPFGYYAYVEFEANNLQKAELVKIWDIWRTEVTSNKSHNFSDSATWPNDFYIEFNTGDQTNAEISITIEVFKATPKANIVKSYVTIPGGGSIFLDTDSWNEGESYKFKSKKGSVYISVATTLKANPNDTHLWNNVFIYDNAVLRSTLASLAQQGFSYVSDNEVILYMAKKVKVSGAAVITDDSDVERVKHRAIYIPNGPASFPIKMDSWARQAAVTLVSSKKNPMKISVQSLSKSYSRAVFSYIEGGPLGSPSSVVNISEDELPMTVGGYANTFCLSEGDGVLGFDVKA